MTQQRVGKQTSELKRLLILVAAYCLAISCAEGQQEEMVRRLPVGPAAPALQPRQFAAVAHDSQHRQSLLFGGTYGAARFDDTWLLASSGWKVQRPRLHPAARISAAVTYDAWRNDFVLFGGRVAQSTNGTCSPGAISRNLQKEEFCGDTWAFTHGNWIRKTPPKSPSPREGHAMAFNAATGQVVLFGGTDNATTAPLSDTWIWEGTTWRQVTPAHHPPGRFSHTMAYDPVHKKVVLFGGDGGNRFLNDTWLWNGRDWEAAPTQATPPELRTNAAMDYDFATRKMVLFSGTAWTTKRNGSIAMDCWSWDGSRWAKLAESRFNLITNFSGLTSKQAEDGLLANGSPSYLWLPEK